MSWKSTAFLLCLFSSGALALEPPEIQVHPGAEDANPCVAMAAGHEQMRERMAAMDARLSELLEQAREAPARQRADALLVVVEELVAQRRQMHEMHARMQSRMMQHMMRHADGETCPMMRGMGGQAVPASGAPPSEEREGAHHPE